MQSRAAQPQVEKSMNIKIASLLARLTTAAEVLKGKKGAVEARALAQRVTAAAHQHMQQMRQLHDSRTVNKPERVRAEIKWLATQKWQRGAYAEATSVSVPRRLRNHPALRELAAPLVMLDLAITTGLIKKEFSDFNKHGTGKKVSVNVYGYGYNLLLVQIRTSSRYTKNGYLSVKIDYMMTDGCTSIKVPHSRIKRAVAQDPALDSPIRALKPVLPTEWAARIDSDAMKLRMQ